MEGRTVHGKFGDGPTVTPHIVEDVKLGVDGRELRVGVMGVDQ